MSRNNEGKNKKALVVTTVASTIDQFCMNDISILQKSHNVDVAANFNFGNNTSKERVKEFITELERKSIIINDINMSRNPLSKDNFTAYKEIKRLIESKSFDIIHCHTPVAAMLVRLAARNARKNGTKVIYTAHGFHFFKGASLKNWLLFYPVELWLARYTDVIITINTEDYMRAKKSFKAGKIEFIPGVGIDTKKFVKVAIDKTSKRKELGVPADAFLVLSVGELNKNKNHEVVIKALAMLNNPKFHYIICGQGSLENYLKSLIKNLELEGQVHLLGFRRDIPEICKSSDVFVFPSIREGLGLAALEAMATGLPLITSNVHGIVDYSVDDQTGYTCSPRDIKGFAKAIKKLSTESDSRDKMEKYNISIANRYDKSNVMEKMELIYLSQK